MWFVTGGCGFIGVNLISRLAGAGVSRIRVFDNLSVGAENRLDTIRRSYAAAEIDLVIGDVRDFDHLQRSMSGVSVVVHLAANTGVAQSIESPFTDCDVNVRGTLNCLEAARLNDVRKFVFASSGAPVGECEPPIHENLPAHPISPYGASKLAGEGYCSAYWRSFGLETVALRFGNVYGPWSEQKQSVVAKFMQSAMVGNVLSVYGDGSQSRDFIYVADLVRAVELAVSASGVGGETFQIATNSETTILELIECISSTLEANGLASPEVRFEEPRVGDVRRNFSDTEKARARLGWLPSTSLVDGLSATLKWYLSGR